jgi:diadenosine tetraphosphate (Ap4A) HIT family hydrolase
MSQSDNSVRSHRISAGETSAPEAEECSFCGIVHGSGEIGATNPELERQFDIPFQTSDFVVFPDAAPVAPRHSLIVPQKHVLSFARLNFDRQQATRRLVDYLTTHLSGPEDHVPYIFEHGSKEADETVGCGITHAHLHILYIPVGCLNDADHVNEFTEYSDVRAAWSALGEEDYYLFGRVGGTVRATVIREAAELKCSMFLRKWFASQMGRPDLADYRRYQTNGPDDMLGEVARTYDRLAALEADPLQ